MSRTKKGSKGPGYEYYSRRTLNMRVDSPGRENKKITVRSERHVDAKAQVKDSAGEEKGAKS